MDKKILAFPKRFFIACAGCGAPFSPYRPRHRICGDCYHWHKALTGIEATRLALREVSK
jgi:hypothetical protein